MLSKWSEHKIGLIERKLTSSSSRVHLIPRIPGIAQLKPGMEDLQAT
jgi:hypothetical protein